MSPNARDTRPRSTAPELFEPLQFSSSPLYMALCSVIARDDFLRRLALQARPGQRPEFAFFGAVHLLLLAGVEHELATFYPSIVGAHASPPDAAGQALVSFCREHEERIANIIGSRLVQTNHVRRAIGLRAALAMIAPRIDAPIDLVEVGSSAGILLGFERYGYRLYRRRNGGEIESVVYGDAASPLQIVCEVFGASATPDLDALPRFASVTGVDLNPINPTDPESRAWLEALVWPEDVEQRRLLSAALDVAVEHPVTVIGGDAVEVLPELARELPPQGVRVVFHAATRIHVPEDRLAAFDAAIRTLGNTGPMWEVAIEYPPRHDPRSPADRLPAVGMTITDPAGDTDLVALVDGHLRWINPLDPVGPR